MSEIGTGLQNATGIRNGIARAGYAFVEASDMRTALGRFGTLADWPAFAGSWNDLLTDTYMADGGRYRRRRFGVWTAGKQGTIERGAHQPHYQGLELQHAERRHRALVRADRDRDRRRRHDAHHPRILPRPVRPARARDRALAHRGPPVPHRGAARRERQADARGHASRRRRLRAGDDGRPPQHPKRHHHHPRPRQAHARQLHPDRPARHARWSTMPAATTA